MSADICPFGAVWRQKHKQNSWFPMQKKLSLPVSIETAIWTFPCLFLNNGFLLPCPTFVALFDLAAVGLLGILVHLHRELRWRREVEDSETVESEATSTFGWLVLFSGNPPKMLVFRLVSL